ncbi:MAG: hypothetical protein ABMA02_00810 [Saprospiraceae bacterium]
MRVAADDLRTRCNVIVAPVDESYPLRDGFEVICLSDLVKIFD